jgi:hypothetical protein
MLVREDDDEPGIAIRDNGSYIMPHGICGETGAALWCPFDISEGETIATDATVDEMLALSTSLRTLLSKRTLEILF